MGNTCIPVADSFQYMAKPIQYCKVKKKIKFRNKKNFLIKNKLILKILKKKKNRITILTEGL